MGLPLDVHVTLTWVDPQRLDGVRIGGVRGEGVVRVVDDELGEQDDEDDLESIL